MDGKTATSWEDISIIYIMNILFAFFLVVSRELYVKLLMIVLEEITM